MVKQTEKEINMSFFAALTLIFITLKLLGVIAWSWFIVLLPMIPIVIMILMGCSYMIFVAVAIFGDSFNRKSK